MLNYRLFQKINHCRDIVVHRQTGNWPGNPCHQLRASDPGHVCNQCLHVNGDEMDALSTYTLFAANREKTLERITSNQLVSREVDYYNENISNVKSADDLVNDTRLLKFTLTAYGLEDMTYAKALIKEVLEGGTDDNSSLANQLIDPRYTELVEDFDFSRYNTATTAFDRVTKGVVDKYYQMNMETEAGEDNVGARLAIYFERKMGDIEDPYDILGDKALLQFFQTAYNVPSQMSLSTIERQYEIISDKLDIEDLSDPEFTDKLVKRFLAMWDMQNEDTSSTSSVVPLISGSSSTSLGLSMDMLSSIQNIKTGF